MNDTNNEVERSGQELYEMDRVMMGDMSGQEFFDYKIKGQGITSKELLEKEFPEPNWIIKDLIPEGLTLFCGRPKIGKSWLALQIAADISVGQPVLAKYSSEPIQVLYLALEDTQRRLQGRFKTISGNGSDNLCFYTDWSRGSPGIAHLRKRLETKEFEHTKLVVIDTLARFLPQCDMNDYSQIYPLVADIKSIADKYGCAIICLHHTRKSNADDFIDTVSGSNAFAGASDTILVLQRTRGDADGFLKAAGRDIDEKELALSLEKDKGWQVLGEGVEYRMSRERREIVEVLKEADGPLRVNEITAITGRDFGSVRMMLSRMVRDFEIARSGRGQYEALK